MYYSVMLLKNKMVGYLLSAIVLLFFFFFKSVSRFNEDGYKLCLWKALHPCVVIVMC